MISVVVPVYNCEKYLRECIESILTQTENNFELILVDDGSKDSSGMICDEFARADGRIRVVHKSNEGACYARRDGVRIAAGEYVCFVDSDDTIDSDLLRVLYEQIEKFTPDVISYGMDNDGTKYHDFYPEGLYEGEKLERIKAPGFFSEDINNGKIVASPCTFAYKKKLIAKYLEIIATGLRTWEDINYSYAPVCDAKSLVILHNSFYKYRANENSVSKSVNWNELSGILYSLDKAEKIYAPLGEDILRAFYGFSLRIIWGCFDMYYDYAKSQHEEEKILGYIEQIRKSDFIKRAIEVTKEMKLQKYEMTFYNDIYGKDDKSVLNGVSKYKRSEKIKRVLNRLKI